MEIHNIPILQPDQTIESIVTMIQLINGISRPTLLKELFGCDAAKIRGSEYRGLLRFYRSKVGSEFSCFEEFIEKHHQIFLLFTFNEDRIVETVITKLRDNNTSGSMSLLGHKAHTIFRSTNWYCPQCAKDEFHSFGYAYAHRTHQVRGVIYCPEHSVPIGPLKDSPNFQEFHGVISTIQSKTQLISIQESPLVLSENESIKRFGLWVETIYSNKLPTVSNHRRNQLILQQIRKLCDPTSKPFSYLPDLQKILIEHYGLEFFRVFDFDIECLSETEWIKQYAIGLTNKNNSIIQLILLNIFFMTPENFKQILRPELCNKNQTQDESKQNTDYPVRLPYQSFYKDRVTLDNTKLIAEKYGITLDSFKPHFNNKSINKKIKIQKILRTKLMLRKEVSAFLSESGDKDAALKKISPQHIFQWLLKNDYEWLNRRVGFFIQFETQHTAHIDAFISEKIKSKFIELRSKQEATRVTRESLFLWAENKFPYIHRIGDTSTINKTLYQFHEYVYDYEARVLKKISTLAKNNRKSEAVLLAYKLLCCNSGNSRLMNRVSTIIVNSGIFQEFTLKYLSATDSSQKVEKYFDIQTKSQTN